METDSLEETVELIEQKQKRKSRVDDTDQKVNEAKTELRELNRDLRKLENDLEDLRRDTRVLIKVFDGDRPASVDDAYSMARTVVSDTKSDVVDLLTDTGESLDSRRSKISGARSQIDRASEDVEDRIDEHRDEWKSKIESARGVLRIVSGGRDLRATLDHMETLLDRRIYDSSEDVTDLQIDWNKYTTAWEQEGVDWAQFQRDHGLADETVDCLQKLSRGEEVRLADVSPEVVDDLKRVRDIGSEIKLSL